MLDFFQPVYQPQNTGTVGGTITIPIPGGGQINVGGSGQIGGAGGQVYYPPVYTGGGNSGQPVYGAGAGGINSLLSNPLVLILIVLLVVMAFKK